MSSSVSSEPPDRHDVRSSHDQDKPATTNAPGELAHPGWRGLSDPMSHSVISDSEALTWHIQQAHTRALRHWQEDPHQDALVPGPGLNLDVSFEAFDDSGTVRVIVDLRAYPLYPQFDAPPHPSTWLIEAVDGPVAGSMHTIAWPGGEVGPPATIEKNDPAGGPPLPYRLRDTDSINGIARYEWVGAWRGRPESMETLSQAIGPAETP